MSALGRSHLRVALTLALVLAVATGAVVADVVDAGGTSADKDDRRAAAARQGTVDVSDAALPLTTSTTGATTAAPEAAISGAEVHWDASLAVPLPVSEAHGPAELTAARAARFGLSRLGAAIAAAHLLARTSPRVGSDVFTATLEHQVRGPNRQALSDAVQTAYDVEATDLGVPAGQPLPGADAEVVGYRVVHYSPSDAAVEVVLSSTALRVDRQLVAVRVSLQRSDDDWALIAPPRGDWGVVTTVLTSRPTEVVPYVEVG